MTEQNAGPALLLVDDETEFVSTLAERLKLRGFSATVAFDGENALQLIARGHFDLILLDVMLPGLHGIEVLRRIREQNPALPVILLTGQAGAKHGIEGMKHGAKGYLSKPVDLRELLDLIESLTERGGANA